MTYKGNTKIATQIEACLPINTCVYTYHDEAKGYVFIVNGIPIWQFITYAEVEARTKIKIKYT